MVAIERIKEIWDYEPDTGLLRWRVSIGPRRAGGVAGSRGTKGYLVIRFEGKFYQAHRIAFAWMTKRWPDPEIDHRNQDTLDNRWTNLREATYAQNTRNRRVMVTNKTGFKGVIAKERYGKVKYEAIIRLAGRQKHLGRFDTPQEAHQAYVRAAEANYAEFARG